MSESVFRSILDVKAAMLERDSHAVALIRQELVSRQELKAQIEQSLRAPIEGFESGGTLQAAIRFRAAEAGRLAKLEQGMAEISGRLQDAEERLKTALGEKRAVERLMENSANQV